MSGGRQEKLILPPITSGAKPHTGTEEYPGGQVEVIEACLHFDVVVLCVGRRAGKTTCAAFLLMEEGARTEGVYFAAYVAQGHPQAEEMFEVLKQEWEMAGLLIRSKNKGQDRWCELRPFGRNAGMKVWFWSGEKGAHKQCLGKGLHRLIIDEAGVIPVEAWSQTFSPMLVDRPGRALIIGTARPDGIGFAWFHDEWIAGQRTLDGKPNKAYDDGYRSYSWPSESNPKLGREWIRKGRARARRM
ncbi:MAG: hypothetical protein ACPGQD_08135, partial [Planctomycetota bacterium]